MDYYTIDNIESIGGIRSIPNLRQKNLERKFLNYKTTVFLSHSHQDRDIIESVIAFLLNIGVYVYVDWLDSSMPKITSNDTATKIKEKITECEKFVVLLSENSKESKWVPWELGYADGEKNNEDIAIMPVRRNSYTNDSEFNGLEYMQLYRRIQMGILHGQSVPSIFPPDLNNGKTVKSWLGG